MRPVATEPAPPAADFPPGLSNAFLFSVFNALSFQIILNSPMVLYARSLGASSTVLGIIAGMMPLLVILQIPAAHHVARVGYKKFVYGGWGLRVAFIFGIALVPFTGKFLDATNRLAFVLMLLFGFNLSRGISSAAWLPWITSLVPAPVRGKYLARDAACSNVGSFLAFLLSAFCLGTQPAPWRFALVFLFSGIMGATSLVFLKRIPEVTTPDTVRASNTPVPWRQIAAYPPFRRLLWFNVGWSAAFGGITSFVVVYLKARAGLTEREILLANSTYFLGGLASLGLLGLHLDRFGSKPVITFSLLTWLLILAGWASLAAGVFAPDRWLVLGLMCVMGLGAALVTMANTRLAMAIIPEMGRSHFFALFSVVGSLVLGVAPVLWGVLIDALRRLHFDWHGFEWNQFSVFFTAVTVVLGVVLVLTRRLHEPAAASMEVLLRELLITPPQRFWFRFWPRE